MSEPIYLRFANRVLREIEAGIWKPGEKLPAEAKLAELEGMSLGTVQKGLNHLAEKGVLLRQHGRGTFVASAETPAQDLKHFRFLGHERREILPVYSIVLSIEKIEATGPWSDFLGRQAYFIMLQRRLNVNGEFDVFSELVVAGPRFAALLDTSPAAFDGVLIRDYLTLHFNCPTLSVEQRIQAAALPPRVCRAIDVSQGTAGLVWDLLARSFRDRPAVYQRAYVPPTDRPLQLLQS